MLIVRGFATYDLDYGTRQGPLGANVGSRAYYTRTDCVYCIWVCGKEGWQRLGEPCTFGAMERPHRVALMRVVKSGPLGVDRGGCRGEGKLGNAEHHALCSNNGKNRLMVGVGWPLHHSECTMPPTDQHRPFLRGRRVLVRGGIGRKHVPATKWDGAYGGHFTMVHY